MGAQRAMLALLPRVAEDARDWCDEPVPHLVRGPSPGNVDCRPRQGSTHSTGCNESGAPAGSVTFAGEEWMEVLYARCAGVDVHKRTAVVCRVIGGADSAVERQVRTFGTLTDELERLADWLAEAQVTHVAMESTGVYWQPIWNILEERGFQPLLANARHIKAVPGRKTDVRDCEWIAELLRHGLLRPSFVPTRPERERRELVRYRAALIRERSAEVNRLHKTLEGANIKLASVASDPVGVSGRRMLEALVAGRTDAAALADLALGRLRDKLPDLERALSGRFGPHQRFLVAQQLVHLDALEAQIARVSTEIEAQARPFEARSVLLDSIPGVGQRTAEVILAELGTDLERFGSAAQLASWAALCPGNRESAGKQKSGRTRQGNRPLRTALVEAARAAGRTKTALGALYQRLARRIGANKAAVAVAHAILRLVYVLLTRNELYHDRPAAPPDPRRQAAAIRHHLQRLQELGATIPTVEVPLPAA
jgi:transposase